jgi:hypothetical protein
MGITAGKSGTAAHHPTKTPRLPLGNGRNGAILPIRGSPEYRQVSADSGHSGGGDRAGGFFNTIGQIHPLDHGREAAAKGRHSTRGRLRAYGDAVTARCTGRILLSRRSRSGLGRQQRHRHAGRRRQCVGVREIVAVVVQLEGSAQRRRAKRGNFVNRAAASGVNRHRPKPKGRRLCCWRPRCRPAANGSARRTRPRRQRRRRGCSKFPAPSTGRAST